MLGERRRGRLQSGATAPALQLGRDRPFLTIQRQPGGTVVGHMYSVGDGCRKGRRPGGPIERSGGVAAGTIAREWIVPAFLAECLKLTTVDDNDISVSNLVCHLQDPCSATRIAASEGSRAALKCV